MTLCCCWASRFSHCCCEFHQTNMTYLWEAINLTIVFSTTCYENSPGHWTQHIKQLLIIEFLCFLLLKARLRTKKTSKWKRVFHLSSIVDLHNECNSWSCLNKLPWPITCLFPSNRPVNSFPSTNLQNTHERKGDEIWGK